MLQIINAIIVYAWLIAALGFLYLIWRSVSGQMQEAQRTLINIAQKSAEAALKAAEAAHILAEREKS